VRKLAGVFVFAGAILSRLRQKRRYLCERMMMKITVKLPKPRNPLVALARVRKAGAHAAFNPARRVRRLEKQKLSQVLSGRKNEIDDV
jgi:hypothetical protein